MTRGWLAWRALLETAARYVEEGYRPVIPQQDEGADIVLFKDDEVVLIECKTQTGDTQRREQVPTRLGEHGQNVRVDVLWLPVAGIARLADIESRINVAQELSQQGNLESAFVLSFAALEAAALRVASTVAKIPIMPNLGETIVALRDHGMVDEATFDQIVEKSRIRNGIVHGVFREQNVTVESVASVTEMARKLLFSTPSRSAGLLDRILDSSKSTKAAGTSIQWLKSRVVAASATEPPDVLNYTIEMLNGLPSTDKVA